MAISLVCPSCRSTASAPETARGRTVKCPKCAAKFVVTAVEGSRDDKGNNRRRIAIWAAGGIAAAALIACGLRGLDSLRESLARERANQSVGDDVERARDHMACREWDKAIEVLQGALKTEKATEFGEARESLARANEGRDKAQAAALLAKAEDAIKAKRLDQATDLLRQYLTFSTTEQREKADSLLAQIAIATSDQQATKLLRQLSNDALQRFKDGVNPREVEVIKHLTLRDVYVATLRKHLGTETARRTEIRQHEEAERLAEQNRQAAERAAALERERVVNEERRRQVEEERIRQTALARANLLDIADAPGKYVGLTYTFAVWIDGGSIRPVKEKNDKDQLVIDGYILTIAPGDRDPNNADSIGNRFGIQPDKLNPFISSKETARKLQDVLRPGHYHKLRLTFTVKAAVLNEWTGLDKKSVGYLADVSSIEEPAEGVTTAEVIRQTMRSATQMLPEEQLKVVKQVEKDRGWRIAVDLFARVSADECASSFKAVGLVGSNSSRELRFRVVKFLAVSTLGQAEEFIKGCYLVEECLIASSLDKFPLKRYSDNEQRAIRRAFEVLSDDTVFDGLPYAANARSAKERILTALRQSTRN